MSNAYNYSPISKLLFVSMDMFYGKETTFSKLKVLELIARIPYQSWEHNFFVWLTHRYGQKKYVERALEEMQMARAAQDNEQWHLFILSDLINQLRIPENFILHVALPQIIAFTYFYVISIIHFIKPAWSYKLNADFENHAEGAYIQFVNAHPEFKQQKVESIYLKYYGGQYPSLAELLLKFADDESHHKEDSLALIERSENSKI